MAVDTAIFKQALGSWASGVTIVTTQSGGKYGGMTASAFSSVSAEPPLVLVCINRRAATCEEVRESGIFAVNILREGQDALSNKFATPQDKASRFEGVAVAIGATGAPLLADSMVSLDCRVEQAIEAGSHTVFIGLVEEVVLREGNPLLYYRGAYRGVTGL